MEIWIWMVVAWSWGCLLIGTDWHSFSFVRSYWVHQIPSESNWGDVSSTLFLFFSFLSFPQTTMHWNTLFYTLSSLFPSLYIFFPFLSFLFQVFKDKTPPLFNLHVHESICFHFHIFIILILIYHQLCIYLFCTSVDKTF